MIKKLANDKIAMRLVAALLGLIIGLVGVVYGSVRKDIDEKAEKVVVDRIDQNIAVIQQDIKTILQRLPKE